ncbi:hypothetical protein [Ekhidna sp.]|jgi:UDP-3-O-[3-hydroxymyristoyl] glucosamine N-acyltransferase|uniref:hypothetical protein n=1 Tax=Ekhidna sp. TaxID=2608089 RepID=UPI0032EAC386
MKILELADAFNLRLYQEDRDIDDLALPFYTQGNQMLSYATNKKFLQAALDNKSIEVVIIPKELIESIDSKFSYLVSDNPVDSFFEIHEHLGRQEFYGKSFKSEISEKATIYPNTHIAAQNVIIEEGVSVYPGAVILENTHIKAGTVIAPNVTIGFDGTQIRKKEGKVHRTTHYGGVIIGENVQIGAGSVIARSLFKAKTIIGNCVTMGNMVNIGHNCVIEDEVSILSQAMVCGSSTVRKGARLSPGAIVSNALDVGEGAKVRIGSVAISNITSNADISGNFAVEHGKNLKHYNKTRKG